MVTSNPTHRVVAVLDALVRQPHRALGLSELARTAGVSKGTCLAIAETLVQHGYLVQHERTRAYRLGPALITAGQAVLSGYVDTRHAVTALARVTGDFDVACSVLARDHDHLVVLDRVGNPDPIYGLSQVGARLPFAPPWGAPFVAWGPPDEIDAWFGRSLVPLGDTAQDGLRRALRAGRRLGFVVTREIPPEHPVAADMHRLRLTGGAVDLAAMRRLAETRLEIGYFVEDVEPTASYKVNHVAVPVLSPAGQPLLVLLAMMFGRVVSGTVMARLGERLIQVASEVAARI